MTLPEKTEPVTLSSVFTQLIQKATSELDEHESLTEINLIRYARKTVELLFSQERGLQLEEIYDALRSLMSGQFTREDLIGNVRPDPFPYSTKTDLAACAYIAYYMGQRQEPAMSIIRQLLSLEICNQLTSKLLDKTPRPCQILFRMEEPTMRHARWSNLTPRAISMPGLPLITPKESGPYTFVQARQDMEDLARLTPKILDVLKDDSLPIVQHPQILLNLTRTGTTGSFNSIWMEALVVTLDRKGNHDLYTLNSRTDGIEADYLTGSAHITHMDDFEYVAPRSCGISACVNRLGKKRNGEIELINEEEIIARFIEELIQATVAPFIVWKIEDGEEAFALEELIADLYLEKLNMSNCIPEHRKTKPNKGPFVREKYEERLRVIITGVNSKEELILFLVTLNS